MSGERSRCAAMATASDGRVHAGRHLSTPGLHRACNCRVSTRGGLSRSWLHLRVNPMPAILESTITCPTCGTAKIEIMPTGACLFFYDCTGCGAVLRPMVGDCCVFCSYGSLPCPPIQESQSCCS